MWGEVIWMGPLRLAPNLARGSIKKTSSVLLVTRPEARGAPKGRVRGPSYQQPPEGTYLYHVVYIPMLPIPWY